MSCGLLGLPKPAKEEEEKVYGFAWSMVHYSVNSAMNALWKSCQKSVKRPCNDGMNTCVSASNEWMDAMLNTNDRLYAIEYAGIQQESSQLISPQTQPQKR
jgi:hypothetical protein